MLLIRAWRPISLPARSSSKAQCSDGSKGHAAQAIQMLDTPGMTPRFQQGEVLNSAWMDGSGPNRPAGCPFPSGNLSPVGGNKFKAPSQLISSGHFVKTNPNRLEVSHHQLPSRIAPRDTKERLGWGGEDRVLLLLSHHQGTWRNGARLLLSVASTGASRVRQARAGHKTKNQGGTHPPTL